MSNPAPRRRPTLRRPLVPLLVIASVLAALAAGCSKSTTTGPVPDCDGTHLLVMTSGRNLPAGQKNIFLYDLDNGGFRAMLGFDGGGQDVRAAITSDGKAIAVERTRAGTGQDVMVYERCSGSFLDRPELVTAADETDPAFSGDTRLLAFVRDTLGVRRIRLYDGLSRRFVPLHLLDSLALDGFDSQAPSLDRAGTLIAFVSGTPGTRRVWLYSRPGDSLLATLSDGFNSANDQRDPWLTPDGRYLAFASDRPGGVGAAGTYDIYLYDLQARAYVAVDSLNSTGNDSNPVLSPDAVYMTFQSDRTGPLAKGKWDLYNYNRSARLVGQAFEESSSEDDVEPYVAWP